MLQKLVLALPLLGFLLAGSSSILTINKSPKTKRKLDFVAQLITVSFLFASAICSTIIFSKIVSGHEFETQKIFTWITSGKFDLNWAIKIDKLSAIMLIVVTYVSSLVHLYSIGYMKEDKSIARFMSYLSLFTFFMLILVTSDNFLQLFVGWEGVGVASYLLIGFWYKKPSANAASIKAFVANRVGDFGLVLAISLIFLTFGTVQFGEIFAAIPTKIGETFTFFGANLNIIDTICILLFIGAMGKSAQIGLHVWLADAMEGPTPVSALIHAATMVTAGVFLVARCSYIFEYSQVALAFVTIIGATTAIFAATIAITQNDIKKIIAYSTCSQLGYMFFACGVSAYSAAMFHLVTHAFFKALLFLSAGSVIYAMHHEQDINKMGQIYKKIPFTYAMFWIGSLALAGFPPLAGFYSKDTILEAAFMSHAPYAKYAFAMGILAAFLTAFYSWRLLFLVFHGKQNCSNKALDHAHEPPKNMTIPLLLLAIGSVLSGLYGAKFLHMISAHENFFQNSIFLLEKNQNLLEEIHHSPLLVKISPLIVGIIAIAIAYLLYFKKSEKPTKISQNFKLFYKISLNKWYFDEIYDLIFVRFFKRVGDFLWKMIDVKIIDRFGPNGLVDFCRVSASKISKSQTGFLFHYATWMVLGTVIIIGFLIIALEDLLHLLI